MKKFLFIDDNKDATELFEAVALQMDIEPTVCNDGATALKLLEANEYDAVILDLSMPVLDGLTIAEEIRRNEEIQPNKKPVCIVFYTARTIDGAVRRIGERVGVQRIYQKPYDILDMLMEIQEICADNKPMMVIRASQQGAASPNMILCLFALIVQIVVAVFFMWLYNKQDVESAYRYAGMRSQRDQYKQICESNLLLDSQKEKFIEQQNLILPPELSGQKACVATENRER